jgi:hypothetical protein
MAAGTPLTRLALGAASVADDLGYVALSDLARALADIPADFRVIGGHMVTVLGARWRLGHELYRETGDVDLGITPIVARDHHVVGRLKDLDCLAECSSLAVASCGTTAVTSFGTCHPMLCVSLGQVMTKVPPSQDL